MLFGFLIGLYYSYSVFSGCGTGYYRTYPNPTSCECEPCPLGTYIDRDNAQECTSCQAGFTTFKEGSTSRTKCLGGQQNLFYVTWLESFPNGMEIQ